jgi:hypothetical protein
MLAKALGRAVDCSVSRIQFTPDLLPSDITGVSAYVSQTGGFEFKPGPVFASIVVGDEINRASAKTQSALRCAWARRRGRHCTWPARLARTRHWFSGCRWVCGVWVLRPRMRLWG